MKLGFALRAWSTLLKCSDGSASETARVQLSVGELFGHLLGLQKSMKLKESVRDWKAVCDGEGLADFASPAPCPTNSGRRLFSDGRSAAAEDCGDW
jgi:hypothetical protein